MDSFRHCLHIFIVRYTIFLFLIFSHIVGSVFGWFFFFSHRNCDSTNESTDTHTHKHGLNRCVTFIRTNKRTNNDNNKNTHKNQTNNSSNPINIFVPCSGCRNLWFIYLLLVFFFRFSQSNSPMCYLAIFFLFAFILFHISCFHFFLLSFSYRFSRIIGAFKFWKKDSYSHCILFTLTCSYLFGLICPFSIVAVFSCLFFFIHLFISTFDK